MFDENYIHDIASELASKNLAHGLSKISRAFKKLEIKNEPLWYKSLDFTFTRNKSRWDDGFAYGGCLVWGTGDEDLILLDVRPNTCGCLVGELFEYPEPTVILDRANKLQDEVMHYTKGDLSKSNHFIGIYRNKEKIIFVIHANPGILKNNSPLGFGLYYDENRYLLNHCLKIDTAEGTVHLAIDKLAKEYYRFYRKAENFSKEFRKGVADVLFDKKYKIISNETHQGLHNMNSALLGCFIPRVNVIYPILTGLGGECILVKFNSLEKNVLLPHGTGYALSSYSESSIRRDGDPVSICLTRKDSNVKEYYNDIGKIPLEYRAIDFETFFPGNKNMEINRYPQVVTFNI